MHVKPQKKINQGTNRHWHHVVDFRAGPASKKIKKNSHNSGKIPKDKIKKNLNVKGFLVQSVKPSLLVMKARPHLHIHHLMPQMIVKTYKIMLYHRYVLPQSRESHDIQNSTNSVHPSTNLMMIILVRILSHPCQVS